MFVTLVQPEYVAVNILPNYDFPTTKNELLSLHNTIIAYLEAFISLTPTVHGIGRTVYVDGVPARINGDAPQ